MPRRRTISCNHCGYMQLKRDEYCDRCGRMTERAKRGVQFFVVRLLIVGAVGLFAYSQITSTVAQL